MKSWKTTAAGILAAALVIGEQLLYAIDPYPETLFDANIVIAQLAVLYGFWNARDNDKSSERVGAN